MLDPAGPTEPTSDAAVIALVGNPNTGKTTFFNALTGLHQRIANYPGVTVEFFAGEARLPAGSSLQVVDLPGTYSLSAASPVEALAVDVLFGRQPDAPIVDAVIAIADASNLRQGLYLISQLLELNKPLVLVLNMSDIAAARGIAIDVNELSRQLGVPVVPVVATRGEGLDAVLAHLQSLLAKESTPVPLRSPLPSEMSVQVDRLVTEASEHRRALTRAEAIRLLVDTEDLSPELECLQGKVRELRANIGASAPLSALETEARHLWIQQVLSGSCAAGRASGLSGSDRLDRILTHRVLGLATFLVISAFLFQGIYRGSAPLMDAIEGLFSRLGLVVAAQVPKGPVQSLLVDGVIAGVGGVLVFLPQIAFLFLLISILEDCGYMARAALLMDRLLGRLGLSGRSFIPMLSSFACAVPGIMSARTIANRRDRYVTILVAPLISCSARLPVYVLFIGAFIPDEPIFGRWIGLQGLTLLGMYTMGALVAIPVAWLLRSTLFRGHSSAFLLELPSYKWPTPYTVGLRVYHSACAFVVRAGSIILAGTIVMWALAYFPRSETVSRQFDEQRAQIALVSGAQRDAALKRLESEEAAAHVEASYLGRAGHFIEPAVEPLGWDWRLGMAALASFPAREIIISALGTIYSLGGEGVDEESADLRAALQGATRADGSRVLGVPVALSVMVFFALCAQCMSTLAVIQRETESWGWALLSFTYMTVLAYVGALATYQATTWLGW
ncbi:MAG: ferrous iron transport protein B [Candidatus Latescibacterota bacterium]|nr:ferrous iron transport protein B [Candidatus Latescibacterota bacterium]